MEVYLITNKLNGKYYVGKTGLGIETRWKRHVLDSLKFRKPRNNFLGNAIRKYGPESDVKATMGLANIGRKLTDEHKKKISEGNKGRMVSDNTKQQVSKAQKGKVLSEETKNKIREARKNQIMKPVTEETKRKISEAHKGRKMSEEAKKNMRKPKSEEHKKNMRGQFKKGNIPWNKRKEDINA